MGFYSGSEYVFVRRDEWKWEEVQKLNPADGKAFDFFGFSVAISGDTAVIGARGDGSGYVYTKIDGKWIENVKIVPDNGEGGDQFGYSVAISGSTALFGAPYTGEGDRGSAYIVDDLYEPC